MDADGLVVKITLDGDTRDLAEELRIPLWNLSVELASQPAWYAFWSAMLAEAQIMLDETKGSLEKITAQVSSEIRNDYKRMSIKVTEAQLSEEVILDPRIETEKVKLLRYKRAVELIKVAVKSFEQRAQTLITLGYRESKQVDVDPTIRIPDRQSGPIGVTRDQILAEMRAKREKEEQEANPSFAAVEPEEKRPIIGGKR